MKTLSASILFVFFLLTSVTGWKLYAAPDTYVIGGEYTLHGGDIVSGSLRAAFAQVTVEDGARVNGRILLVSSTLDLQGGFDGEIVSVGSEISMSPTARLAQSPRELHVLPFVVLLPEMVREQP